MHDDDYIARDFRSADKRKARASRKERHARHIEPWIIGACVALAEGAEIGGSYSVPYLVKDGVRLNHKLELHKLVWGGYLKFCSETCWTYCCSVHDFSCLELSEKGKEVARNG